jgi:hypothetical protein
MIPLMHPPFLRRMSGMIQLNGAANIRSAVMDEKPEALSEKIKLSVDHIIQLDTRVFKLY